jgi:5-methyltetrahydrofolate--homocysteine methyltransferase
MTLLPRAGEFALLDGGMGTALLARGLPGGAVPERWVVERPWEVARVHAQHAAAGARILLTCTFNLARVEAAELQGSVEEVARRAVWLARSACAGAVAGCAGATALSRADGEGASDGELRERFERAFRALAGAGADLLWTETHLTLREARAAVWAARRTGRPVVATAFLAPGTGGLAAVDGTPGHEFLEALWRDGAAAVGVNCVEPDGALAALVARAAARVPVPLVVKPNAGLPGAPWAPSRFAEGTMRAIRAGASLAGGCCGTSTDHLRALAAMAPRRPRAVAQARG